MKLKILTTVFTLLLIFAYYEFIYPKLGVSQKPANPQEVVITMERTPCYGSCPHYKLTINGKGEVVYEGKQFVETVGSRSSKTTEEEVLELVNEFYKIDYFSFKDEYTASISDLPTTITSITIGGTTKTVRNYYGAPKALYTLEEKIDEVTNSQSWVGRCKPGLCEPLKKGGSTNT